MPSGKLSSLSILYDISPLSIPGSALQEPSACVCMMTISAANKMEINIIMPRCACASEVYTVVCVCVVRLLQLLKDQ